jgi:chemotaxis signal transduction protein
VKTIVRFRTPHGDYAVPVEEVSEVRSAAGLTPLPAPRPGVAGLMRSGDEALPVLTILAATGRHVVVIDRGARSFGLLVEEVTAVHEIDEASIGVSPSGQDRELVSGVLSDDDGLVLLLDVDAVAGKLAP